MNKGHKLSKEETARSQGSAMTSYVARLEEALRISEEKYKNLFQNSLVAMLRIERANGKITRANNKCLELFSLPSSDAANFYELLAWGEKARFSHTLEAKGVVENLEMHFETADGQSIWASCNARPNENEGLLDCILKDITDTKENLLELQKVNFELDSFIYHASHDLRSPLRSILGLIAIYRLETDAKIKLECIEKIEDSVHRLDDLVMDLLSISRNDRVNDPKVDMNLMFEISHAVSSYYNASDTSNLEIRTHVRQTCPYRSDLTRVRIILNNLISNALKYRSYHNQPNYIFIKAVVDHEKLVLKVEDNGEGIEQKKLPHIFDMFYRATERSEGSGLGLYIVKKVADKLKAKIQVESEELMGTTFTVVIPNNYRE